MKWEGKAPLHSSHVTAPVSRHHLARHSRCTIACFRNNRTGAHGAVVHQADATLRAAAGDGVRHPERAYAGGRLAIVLLLSAAAGLRLALVGAVSIIALRTIQLGAERLRHRRPGLRAGRDGLVVLVVGWRNHPGWADGVRLPSTVATRRHGRDEGTDRVAS